MYSSLDKAIVAFVMGVFAIIGVVWKPINVSPETITSVIAIATPILVYLWPNAPKDPTT